MPKKLRMGVVYYRMVTSVLNSIVHPLVCPAWQVSSPPMTVRDNPVLPAPKNETQICRERDLTLARSELRETLSINLRNLAVAYPHS
jgi:hypothetical protein